MCGIAGIFNLSGSDSRNYISSGILKKMSDVIVHRGPDSEGQWISQKASCGFSFRRLAIIDLSDAGSQPMSTADGRFTIVFNGEIYNHLELRKELESRGYKYKSGTDTETILYGYNEFGAEIVERLIGMWAFAVWDEEKHELFASRDRIGIKPLYFMQKNGIFLFASEIKSILEHPLVSPELNLSELPNYLNFGMTSRNESLFKNIRKLPAGHFLTISIKDGLQLKRYWSPFMNPEYSRLSQKESQEETLRILRKAVEDRMMSDVPFGVFLSGGIDSSLNAALMAELMDRPVDTYTVGFKELEKYNELEYARKIAKLFKTNHREILIDDRDAFPILQDLTWHEDEPNADPVCIPLYFLSKLTRESGTIVVQVGEGSDEQFTGYSWMMREYNFYNSYWQFFTALPKFLKKSIYAILKAGLEPAELYQVLEYFRRGAEGEQLYWSGMPIFSPSFQKHLFSKKHVDLSKIPAKYADSLHKDALSFKPDADYLQRILFVELQNRLAEILLMRVDKIGMAHSIEARVPFLDHRLVEFTASLRPEIRTPDKITTKYVLKKAVEGILPDEIIYRKKQGFWAPVNEWLRNQWYDFAKDEVLNSYFVKEGIFNRNFIEKMLLSHKKGKRNYGVQIFSLLTLSLWQKRFNV